MKKKINRNWNQWRRWCLSRVEHWSSRLTFSFTSNNNNSSNLALSARFNTIPLGLRQRIKTSQFLMIYVDFITYNAGLIYVLDVPGWSVRALEL